MDTASKLNNATHFLSFSRKLFLSVISLFLVFAGCFLAYQYQREKEYKIETKNYYQLEQCISTDESGNDYIQILKYNSSGGSEGRVWIRGLYRL